MAKKIIELPSKKQWQKKKLEKLLMAKLQDINVNSEILECVERYIKKGIAEDLLIPPSFDFKFSLNLPEGLSDLQKDELINDIQEEVNAMAEYSISFIGHHSLRMAGEIVVLYRQICEFKKALNEYTG